jgi:8-oxo-dGTP pyrophosphatase MutT (NUDIX family)
MEAARREVLEETGLEVKVDRLVWHVEEVSKKRGQRYVNYFTANIQGGQYALGKDPEFDDHDQVLREIRFVGPEEMKSIEYIYPAFLKKEIWAILRSRENSEEEIHCTYRIREEFSV